MPEEIIEEEFAEEPGLAVEAGVGDLGPAAGAAELPEEEVPDEDLSLAEPEVGATTPIALSSEDVPQLAALEIGDTITFQVDDKAEDGTVTLSVAESVAPPALQAVEEAVSEEETVLSALQQ